jgi:hypothetical protein
LNAACASNDRPIDSRFGTSCVKGNRNVSSWNQTKARLRRI